jgi:ABC-type multidrug transport system permease subunit
VSCESSGVNALIIARHHLVRLVRSPGLIVILAAIPITLALIEYAAFGPTVASGKLPPIKVLVLDEDQTFLSRAVPQLFTGGGPMKDTFETSAVSDRAEAQGLFQHNQASALIVVPTGFQQAILSGNTAELQFAPNPLQTISPAITKSALDMMALIGNGLYRQAAEPIRRVNQLRLNRQSPTSDDIAEISRDFFEAGQRLTGLRSLTNVQLTVVRPTGERETGFAGSPRQFFAFIFPGLIIFGLMFISQAIALRLLRDRAQGVDRRIAIAPVSTASRYLGSLLFFNAALLVLLVLLIAIGAAVFRIELRDPPALLAFATGFALFASGLHLAIIGVAKNDRSASFIGTAIITVLSLLGGTFIPAETYPPFLRSLAFITPNGAAQQGFVDILAHGRTLADVSGRLIITWCWALAVMAAALATMRSAQDR